MPLIKQPLPANTYYVFDILVKVMMFDLFEVHNYMDFGFTQTEPWDTNYAWLGYETSNYVELMGSNNILIAILIGYALLIFLFYRLHVQFKS